jgi:hypothetical protein
MIMFYQLEYKWRIDQEFPRKYFTDTWAAGKLLHNAHDSHHLLAGFLFSERHIFMQALSRLGE